jgi:hypothetical protein
MQQNKSILFSMLCLDRICFAAPMELTWQSFPYSLCLLKLKTSINQCLAVPLTIIQLLEQLWWPWFPCDSYSMPKALRIILPLWKASFGTGEKGQERKGERKSPVIKKKKNFNQLVATSKIKLALHLQATGSIRIHLEIKKERRWKKSHMLTD